MCVCVHGVLSRLLCAPHVPPPHPTPSGSELSVLQSMDFRSLSVGLLVVELRVGNANFNVQVRSLLREAGYELVRTLKARATHAVYSPKPPLTHLPPRGRYVHEDRRAR